jgi:hypothetical protein
MLDNLGLPGMEDFMDQDNSSDEEEWFKEGPSQLKNYFDAATLPDAPTYQKNAENSQTYVLHVVLPTQDELRRAIIALTGGARKALAGTSKEAIINSMAVRKEDGLTWLQYWEKIYGIEPVLDDSNPADDDEAHAPIERPAKAEKPASKKKVKVEIPVVVDHGLDLSIANRDVFIAFPTYKRSNDVKTWKSFDAGIAAAFVEPQELDLYRRLHKTQQLYVYHENEMTINQKRNFIIENVMQMGKRWLFMLEDDLTGFFVRDGLTGGGSHKLSKSNYTTVMNGMLNFAAANNIAELGLSQQQSNHFYEETHVKYSCKVTEFCLFDLDILRKHGINYDTTMPAFEDFEISMQLLLAGEKVGLYTPAAFGHVTMATNKSGGFIEDGLEKRRAMATDSILKMILKHPGLVEYKEGRLFPEPKINWTELRSRIKV